jgi:hypothetical protein
MTSSLPLEANSPIAVESPIAADAPVVLDLSPDEVMDRAADLLDIHGWGRFRLRDNTGELCLIGAMQMVVYPERYGHLPQEMMAFDELPQGLVDARTTLERELDQTIPFWNDRVCTGHYAATELLRNSAKRYREENS